MNTATGTLLLILTPLLPLLLAFPSLHSRLFQPGLVALLPALFLLVTPADISVELSWLLLGSGFGISNESGRLLLAMSVLLWAAAFLMHPAGESPADDRLTTFFLLALAGNLGAILATGVVGFFAFSVLTGYAFYGLLTAGETEEARRAGHIYLIFLILADLALFEALLIAATTTRDLQFEAVHQAIAQSPSPGLYLSMVLAGFALKAAVWPLHFWLPPAYHSVRPEVALLLGGVPVAIGLLGAVRWLPLGEMTFPGLALLIQSMGIAAMLYATVAGLTGLIKAQLETVPAHAVIAATGLFTFFLGTSLAAPSEWNSYENRIYLLIVFLGIGSAVLAAIGRWLKTRHHSLSMSAKQMDDTGSILELWAGTFLRWGRRMGTSTLPRLRSGCLATAGHLWQPSVWRNILDGGERFLQRWAIAITLFLVLGMTTALFFIILPCPAC